MPLMAIKNAQGEVIRVEDWPFSMPRPVLAPGETAVRATRHVKPLVQIILPAAEPPPPPERWSLIDASGTVVQIILWDGASDVAFEPGLTARRWREGDEVPPPPAPPFDDDYALERVAIEQLKRDYLASFDVMNEETPEPSPPEPAPAEPDLAAENAELRARIAELESSNHIDRSERPESKLEADELGPSGAVGGLEALETDLTRLQAKIDAVRAGKQEMTPDELIEMHKDNPPGAAAKLEDAVRALKGEARRKLSELLNVELAELKNNRGMAGQDLEREQQIEYLLGLFTRLGEI